MHRDAAGVHDRVTLGAPGASMTRTRASSIRATARVAFVGTFALALVDGCADKTPTTPAGTTPTDSLGKGTDSKLPPLVGQIAFVSTRDGSPYIYVAAANGSSLRRLTKGVRPEWSPD